MRFLLSTSYCIVTCILPTPWVSQIRHVLGEKEGEEAEGSGGESGGVASFKERRGKYVEGRLENMG